MQRLSDFVLASEHPRHRVVPLQRAVASLRRRVENVRVLKSRLELRLTRHLRCG